MTPDMQQAFDDLGVSPTASAAEIRRAWRALVRTYHPDQVRGDPVAANQHLARLNAAFDLVSSAAASGKAAPQPTKPQAPRCPSTQHAPHRAAREAASRRRAAKLDAREAVQRAAAAARRAAQSKHRRPAPKDTAQTRTARALFLRTLQAISPDIPSASRLHARA